jgi:hypothetical protein
MPHGDLLKVVEVLVDPMLEDVEDAELHRLAVLLPEPFHVLCDLKHHFRSKLDISG